MTVLGAPAPRMVLPALRAAAVVAVLTAVAAGCAAAAEAVRLSWILRGRTEVLPAAALADSDRFVMAAAATAGGLAVLLGAVLVPAVVRWYATLVAACGRRPVRGPGGIVARLLVPGWNIYGAGQVLAEIDVLVGRVSGRGRRLGAVLVWWGAWTVNVLVATTALGFTVWAEGDSARAAGVQWHLAADVAAAVAAGLLASLLISWNRSCRGGRLRGMVGWQVAPPASTPRNRLGSAAVDLPDPGGDRRHHRGGEQGLDDIGDLGQGEVVAAPGDHGDTDPVRAELAGQVVADGGEGGVDGTGGEVAAGLIPTRGDQHDPPVAAAGEE